jgi:hypothetical protein
VEAFAKANIVEHGQSSRGNKDNTSYNPNGKGKAKVLDLGPKKGGLKKTVGPF